VTSVATGESLRDRLAAVVGATLRVSVTRIGRFDTFASLGMDSLAAVELTAAIEDDLGIELPLTAVHEHPDIDSLCRFIEDGTADGARERQIRQMRADAELPDDIAPHGFALPTSAARHVLLTGATGFLGAYLLRTLLDETTATVHCLVRSGRDDGFARVRRNLVTYGLWHDADVGRLCIVDGDLSRPRLGRDARAFAELAAEINAIFHAAADVNWVHSYENTRDANVVGTRELLRLACEGTPKPLHFVSSTSVCHSTSGPRSADENTDVFAGADGLWLGYAQSKCVAESLVREAGARGLPVTIVRPSLISGDALGRSNVNDLTSRFIAGCIRMRSAPDLDWRMDCVPVDDAARGIVRLALAHEQGSRVHHVIATRPRHWREGVLWMRLRGYDVELLPYAEWSERLRATEDASHPLYALRPFFLRRIPAEDELTLPELFEESRRSSVSGALSLHTLDTLGVRIGDVDARLLSRYFDDFVRRGIVPDVGPTKLRHARWQNRPLLEPSQALATGLGEWLGEGSLHVESVALSPRASDESIVAELTAWRAGTEAGLFDAVVSTCDAHGTRGDAHLFVKSKSADAESIDVAVALAGLVSPVLGDAVPRFRDELGITRSHVRELAIYALRDPRLRSHTPRPILIERDDERRRWLVALESIDDAVLINANDPSLWNDASIDAALAGLANIHAVGLGDASLAAEPWLPPRRDSAKYVTMTPLWRALAKHAHARSAAFRDPALRRVHERLTSDVASWSDALDAAPRTLIHNDFNPRNMALRRGVHGLRLCAFDWELATIGAPQRDLAEFLVFVMPPNASGETISSWVERYRSLLAATSGVSLPREEWEAGFSAALSELLVDRLSFYVMIDRVRPQRFLSRVVRSWLNVSNRWKPKN
jgi:thioester reductase-like protein